MPSFTVRGPSGASVAHRFDQDRIRIGRAESSDLVIRDPELSRHHVEVRWEGRWIIEDLGSMNGTLLGGRRLKRPEPILPGDEFQLGSTSVGFELADADGAGETTETNTVPKAWSARGSGLAAVAKELEVVGRSPALGRVLEAAATVAPSNASVLILGENGTGKELLARHIHKLSARSERPFVVVNCPALPGALFESELFGIEKGVATGVEARPGRLEAANGGTLLLDEIGDLELGAQAKILRFLQERTLERVGGRSQVAVDVRLLAATNHDLEAAIARGTFRRDLYHRLNVVTLTLPPLRDRREDIAPLAESFLRSCDGPRRRLSEEALAALERHDFPGNVRELEHMIERAQLFAKGPEILASDLPIGPQADPPAPREAPGDEAALYARIVERGESFWDVVREPYLRREVSREQVRALIERGYEDSGRSYKSLARRFGIEAEYKRFLNFLQNHDLRVRKP